MGEWNKNSPIYIRKEITMRAETRRLLNKLNDVLDEWDDYNLTSNKINQTKDMIEEFYNKYGKEVKNNERFSTRIKLNNEQEEELLNIAESMALDDRSYVETYEDEFDEIDTLSYDKPINIDAFNKMKEQYPEYFDDLQDYIHFFDRINNFKDDKVLSSILSSDQYVSLMNYGSSDFDENELDKMLVTEYEQTGMKGKSLYEKILGMIS